MFRACATFYLFRRSISSQKYLPRVAAKEFVFYRIISTALRPREANLKTMQIVDALRFGERSKALDLLSSLGHGNFSVNANDFIDILKYCAKSHDPAFAIETWRVMEEKQISQDPVSSRLMMQVLCDGGYFDEAFRLLDLLGESPDRSAWLPIYNTYLLACAGKGSISHANRCLDLMDSRLTGLNEVTYLGLLKLAVLQKNLSAAQEIRNECIKKYRPNMISIRKFIWAFSELRDLKSAHKELQQMVVLAMSNGTSIFNNEKGKLCTKQFDIPVPFKHDIGLEQSGSSQPDRKPGNEDQDIDLTFNHSDPQHVLIRNMDRCKDDERVLNVHISELDMKVLRWSFNNVIHACARLINFELAEQLLAQMQKLGMEPSSCTFAGFIKAAVRKRDFGCGIKVLNIMHRNELKPSDGTLATFSVSCSKALELDLAEALLHQMSGCKHARPFNEFFKACDILDKPERAVRAFAKMRKLKILPTIRTYELLFSLFGVVNGGGYEESDEGSQRDALRRIKAIEMDMITNGIQHSQSSMYFLLRALAKEHMTELMIQYFKKAETIFGHTQISRTPLYNVVLISLIKDGKTHIAAEIFKIMMSGCVPRNLLTYGIMIYSCTLEPSLSFSSACALLSLMYRDGFYPNAVVFADLLKILLREQKFYEAFDLLDRARAEGIQFTIGTYNTVLKEVSKELVIDGVEFLVQQMHQEKIKPDASTCFHVFYAYVRSGLHNTAMEALQVLSLRMLCDKYGSLSEEDLKIIMEELVLLRDDREAQIRALQLFQNYEEYLAVALLNLRWSAMLGYTIPWLAEQSAWAKRLAATYGCDAR